MMDVCLAISSFRNDEAVANLLELATALVPDPFSRILVVDSLATGKIPELIAARGWDKVSYHAAPTNLGSAGNLASRLELAAETPADAVYALNHDGMLRPDTVRALIRAAAEIPRFGAAYPLRRLADGCYDVSGTSRLMRPRIRRSDPVASSTVDVYSGSSNGTLYGLAPVREGLVPWSDLWMGFEDVAYGWLLHRRGYRQVIVRDALFEDPYEFRSVALGGRAVQISDKAAWYAYYASRNLILIDKKLRPAWDVRASLYLRIALECGTTLLFRRQKAERLRLILRGVADGVAGRTGKRHDFVPRPASRGQ